MTHPICTTCQHYRPAPPNDTQAPKNSCDCPAFPRELDLVTGAVLLPACGTMRAKSQYCGETGEGYSQAGVMRRIINWVASI